MGACFLVFEDRGMRHISEYLDECLKEVFEERAAIREFCGNQPREEAEVEAMKEVEKLTSREANQ